MVDPDEQARMLTRALATMDAVIREIEQGVRGLDALNVIHMRHRPYVLPSCEAVWKAMHQNRYHCYCANPDHDDRRPFDPKVVLLGGVHPESYADNAGIIAHLVESGFLAGGGSVLMEGTRGVVNYEATGEINRLMDDLLRGAPAGDAEGWKRTINKSIIERFKVLGLLPSDVQTCYDTRRRGGMMLEAEGRLLIVEETSYVPKVYDLLRSKGIHLAFADTIEEIVLHEGQKQIPAAEFWLDLVRRATKGFLPAVLDRVTHGNVVVVFGLYDLLCSIVMNELAARGIHYIGAVPKKIDKLLPDPPRTT